MGRLRKRKPDKNLQKQECAGWRILKSFRTYIVFKHSPAVRSKVWSKLIFFASLGVILRSPVLRIYVAACYIRGFTSRRPCGWWGRRRCWVGGGADE